MIWCIKTYIIAYVKTQKNVSDMSSEALAPDSFKTSAAKILTMQDKRFLILFAILATS